MEANQVEVSNTASRKRRRAGRDEGIRFTEERAKTDEVEEQRNNN